MTMSAHAFLDSNVLIYSAFKGSPHFRAATALRDRALAGVLQLYISPQVLAEFFAVITDPRRVSESHTPHEALAEIEKYCSTQGFVILPQSVAILPKWIELCRHHPVTGQGIFDLQIVATMLVHNIRTIYTFNKADFQKFDEIKVIVPSVE